MGNASGCFANMDDVKAYASAMKPRLAAEDYELLLYLLGLLENRGLSESVILNGESVAIDKYIAPLVAELNKHGIRTLSSCSGLKEEHPEGRLRPECGYLSVAFDNGLFVFLTRKCDGTAAISEGEAYLEHCISIRIDGEDGDRMKDKWDKLQLIFKEWMRNNSRNLAKEGGGPE